MEYTVQSQSLTQVANAIREKTRDPALLEFPDEFVVAIRSIQPQQMDIIGGTVGWNQLLQNGNFSDGTIGWSTNGTQYGTLSANNNICTCTIGSSVNNSLYIRHYTNLTLDHIYIISMSVNPSDDTNLRVLAASMVYNSVSKRATANQWNQLYFIIKIKVEQSYLLTYINTSLDLTTDDTVSLQNINVIDLTTLLGSTIADKIYTLEQSTPGAGVAIIKQLLTKDYYPYSLPDLSSIMYANDWENFGDSYILNGFLRFSGNSLYRWGDILSNGNVTRKTARIAMTDLTWASGTMAAYEATLPNWVGSNGIEPILETVISDAYPMALYDVWSGLNPTDLSAAPDKYLYQIYESQSPDTKHYKIYIKDTSIATVSDLMTALAGKEIVYATSSESYSVAGKRFRGRADIDLPDPSSITTNGKLLTYIDSTEAAIYTLSSTSTQVLYTWQDSTDYAAAALDSGLQWEDDDNGGIVWWADDAPDLSQEDYEWFISLYEEII